MLKRLLSLGTLLHKSPKIAGDASILMNIQELGTLAQYNLPAKVVIVNNQWQGMVR